MTKRSRPWDPKQKWLLLYAYTQGVFSSRKIAKACAKVRAERQLVCLAQNLRKLVSASG